MQKSLFPLTWVGIQIFLLFVSGGIPNLKNVEASPEEVEQEALKYLAEIERPYSTACYRYATAAWNFMTNVTEATEKANTIQSIDFQNFQAKIQKELYERFPSWRKFKNDTIRREFKQLSISGPGTMPKSEVVKMTNLQTEMETAYSTATVCEYGNPSNCSIRLDPELEQILKKEKDPKVLAHYWTAWHDKLSKEIPPSTYAKYLTFQKKMAEGNEYKNMFEMWMDQYDTEMADFTASGFQQQIFDMYEEIRPMYETLHAYVRMKLRQRPEYGSLIGKCGYIPIYLTGNMWAQDWSKLEPISKPFPNAPTLDATAAMLKKNYTVLKMYQESDKFFTGLGLPPMTSTFWNRSMIERPSDGRKVACHASAHDMCLGGKTEDFRIKHCAKVDFYQLYVVHHEMGHIAYFHQYRDQNVVFRNGANPGFHEALGDSVALAVITPHHLQCHLGLELGLDPIICDEKAYKASRSITEADINFLYITALTKLVVLPSALSVDAWRWEAFQGKLTPDQYNKRWWELRKKYQGVEAPTDRLSSKLFDPAAKYHIPSDVEYLRYFLSFVLQFQFYEAMCIAAGQYDPNDSNSRPLFQCDFAGSKEAGRRLGNMMKVGSSKGWLVALEALTGSRSMSIAPLKHYFQPLLDHLEKELSKNGEVPGFGDNC